MSLKFYFDVMIRDMAILDDVLFHLSGCESHFRINQSESQNPSQNQVHQFCVSFLCTVGILSYETLVYNFDV